MYPTLPPPPSSAGQASSSSSAATIPREFPPPYQSKHATLPPLPEISSRSPTKRFLSPQVAQETGYYPAVVILFYDLFMEESLLDEPSWYRHAARSAKFEDQWPRFQTDEYEYQMVFDERRKSELRPVFHWLENPHKPNLLTSFTLHWTHHLLRVRGLKEHQIISARFAVDCFCEVIFTALTDRPNRWPRGMEEIMDLTQT